MDFKAPIDITAVRTVVMSIGALKSINRIV